MSADCCSCCGAVPEIRKRSNGDMVIIVTHINPTEDQRRRAKAAGVPVGEIQEQDLKLR